MTKTSGVCALGFTIASALGCATFSVDASFTKSAIERAAAVSADASSVESAGSDGSRYAYVNAGDNATCFRGIVDDRDGAADPRARFLVLNRERGDSDRAAPSYASWRLR